MADIGIVLPSLGKGGAQRATVAIANYLCESGHQVTIYYFKKDAEEFEVSDQCMVFFLAAPSFKKGVIALSKKISCSSHDVVYSALWHINTVSTLAVKYANLMRKKKIRLVCSVHNNPASIVKTENGLLSTLYYRILLKFADKTICVSQGVMQALIKEFRIPPENLVWINNPAITEFHEKEIATDISDLTIEFPWIKNNYLLFAGRLDYQKDAKMFIDVCAEANMFGVLIGDGPERAALEAYAAQNNAAVVFLGFRSDVIRFMCPAFALLLTSRFEGFGLVIVESMFAGTPVISNDCDHGPREIIENGVNGFLVDGVDALSYSTHISSLLTDRSLYEKIVASGKATASNYSSLAVCPEYEHTLALKK